MDQCIDLKCLFRNIKSFRRKAREIDQFCRSEEVFPYTSRPLASCVRTPHHQLSARVRIRCLAGKALHIGTAPSPMVELSAADQTVATLSYWSLPFGSLLPGDENRVSKELS